MQVGCCCCSSSSSSSNTWCLLLTIAGLKVVVTERPAVHTAAQSWMYALWLACHHVSMVQRDCLGHAHHLQTYVMQLLPQKPYSIPITSASWCKWLGRFAAQRHPQSLSCYLSCLRQGWNHCHTSKGLGYTQANRQTKQGQGDALHTHLPYCLHQASYCRAASSSESKYLVNL